MKVVRNQLSAADTATRDAFSFQHTKDYQALRKRYAHLSLQAFSGVLFDFMEKKYYWRYWVVAILEHVRSVSFNKSL